MSAKKCVQDKKEDKNCSKVRKNHLFDNCVNNVYDKSVLSLGPGIPGPDLLKNCCYIFERATQHRMTEEYKNNAYLFQYAAEAGNYNARKALAGYLTNEYGTKVNSEDLFLTAGATQGIVSVLTNLIELNGVIFVDDFTYMLALDLFKSFTNLKVVPVNLNCNGVDLNDFVKKVCYEKRCPGSKLFWGMYYTIPMFHNPTGIVFCEDVLKKLIQYSRKYDLLILCDDVYNLLSYADGYFPHRLFYYDDPNDRDYRGNVISNGSFAKILSPGARAGWMECPKRCLDALNNSGVFTSGGSWSSYTYGIIQSLIELNLLKCHVDMVLENYKRRMKAMCKVFRTHLPLECHYLEPKGGAFIWISLPPTYDGDKFAAYLAENYNIIVIPGSKFSVNKNSKNSMRISPLFHQEDVLEEAARKICDAIKEYCSLE